MCCCCLSVVHWFCFQRLEQVLVGGWSREGGDYLSFFLSFLLTVTFDVLLLWCAKAAGSVTVTSDAEGITLNANLANLESLVSGGLHIHTGTT